MLPGRPLTELYHESILNRFFGTSDCPERPSFNISHSFEGEDALLANLQPSLCKLICDRVNKCHSSPIPTIAIGSEAELPMFIWSILLLVFSIYEKWLRWSHKTLPGTVSYNNVGEGHAKLHCLWYDLRRDWVIGQIVRVYSVLVWQHHN